MWEVPLTPRAQTMVLKMGDNAQYSLYFRFSRISKTWLMDVNDAADNGLVHSIPLVTGVDLFGQLRYLGIGGGVPMIAMTIAVGRSPDEIPTYENLGIDSHLYFKTLV
jgi:hypothetical protein